MKKKANAQKSNFWNDLRVRNNYSFYDLAGALDLAPSTVAMWFCGKTMPKEKHVHSLCELFGVEYSVGHDEFSKIHGSWVSSRPAKKDASSKQGKGKVKLVPMVSADPMASTPEVEEVPTKTVQKFNITDFTSVSDIFRELYGNLSFDDYEEFRASYTAGENPLKILYNKVDYDTYMSLFTKLKG